ncbi:hypothetical protein BKI52_10885 [marine bacterium AO1-C]|nr:hypothetical protein BKI52_10885 [marine bacterium AO1-C]
MVKRFTCLTTPNNSNCDGKKNQKNSIVSISRKAGDIKKPRHFTAKAIAVNYKYQNHTLILIFYDLHSDVFYQIIKNA